MLGCRKLSRKKTRQRRDSGCRGSRDAVGVATKCRGADQYGGRGGCGKGKRGTFGRQGGMGTRYAQFCRVSVTLSLFLLSSGKNSFCDYRLPYPSATFS